MKKIILFFLGVYILTGCKVERSVPSNYELIEGNFHNENYERVIELLGDSDIKYKERTDWFYFFYGVSLYKIGQSNSRDALKYIKIANSYNDTDYNITYYLGEIFFDIGNYKKAARYFEKCIKGNLNKSITMNNNPVLWLLLSKLKLQVLNLDKFVKVYGVNESQELERFALILKNHILQADDVLYFIRSKNMSDREKLLVIDALLDNEQNKEQFLEILYSMDLPKLFELYFGTRLIYYTLGNKEECFDLIKKLNSSGDESFIILDCNEYIIWEYFEKYCAFYYWLVKDYQKVNLSAQNYYYIKKRLSSYMIKRSEDLHLFYKEFRKDKEFSEIIKRT